jgi:hypothetical protein
MAGCVNFLKNRDKNHKNNKLKILVILSGGNISSNVSKIIWEKDYLLLVR